MNAEECLQAYEEEDYTSLHKPITWTIKHNKLLTHHYFVTDDTYCSMITYQGRFDRWSSTQPRLIIFNNKAEAMYSMRSAVELQKVFVKESNMAVIVHKQINEE
jgi:predicted choloylglycine hydrolase